MSNETASPVQDGHDSKESSEPSPPSIDRAISSPTSSVRQKKLKFDLDRAKSASPSDLSQTSPRSPVGGHPLQRTRSPLLESTLSGLKPNIYVSVVEAKNIFPPSKGKAPDAYACLQLGTEKYYTTTLYNHTNPRWNEEHRFGLANRRQHLIIRLWNEDLVLRDTFLGEVRIPFWEYRPDVLHDKWLKLEAGKDMKSAALVAGEIRIRFLYHIVDDYVIDTTTNFHVDYEKLSRHLLDPSMASATFILKFLEVTEVSNTPDGEQCLQAVLTVFMHNTFKSTMHLLEWCIEYEVAYVSDRPGATSNVFRRNSLAPKILAKYCYAVGQNYLEELLKPLIENIMQTRKTFEIDPNRVSPKEDIEKNVENLSKKCQKFIHAIVSSLADMPVQLQWIAHILRRVMINKLPDAVANALASMFFLRFMCPAIVSPQHYGIVEAAPKTKSMRFLLLIAKTLQSLANRIGDAKQQDKPAIFIKEPYMEQMKPFINENTETVSVFLNTITEVIGKSDVLPSFENLDSVNQRRALMSLHTFLHKYRARLSQAFTKGFASVAKSRKQEFTFQSLTMEQRRSMSEFFNVIDSLGLPPKRESSGDIMPAKKADDAEAEPVVARPGFFQRLRNRMVSNIVTDQQASQSMLQHELQKLKDRYTLMLEDRNAMLEERDNALKAVHAEHSKLEQQLNDTNDYVALLERTLAMNNIKLPPHPHRNSTVVEQDRSSTPSPRLEIRRPPSITPVKRTSNIEAADDGSPRIEFLSNDFSPETRKRSHNIQIRPGQALVSEDILSKDHTYLQRKIQELSNMNSTLKMKLQTQELKLNNWQTDEFYMPIEAGSETSDDSDVDSDFGVPQPRSPSRNNRIPLAGSDYSDND